MDESEARTCSLRLEVSLLVRHGKGSLSSLVQDLLSDELGSAEVDTSSFALMVIMFVFNTRSMYNDFRNSISSVADHKFVVIEKARAEHDVLLLGFVNISDLL